MKHTAPRAGFRDRIARLFNFEPPATDEEIHAAASQPSGRNSDPFARAIAEIATVLVRGPRGCHARVPPRAQPAKPCLSSALCNVLE